MRIFLRKQYNYIWQSRHYDSWPFGAWWSLWNRNYKAEGMVFDLPFSMMPIGFRARFLYDTYEIGERTLAKKYLEPHDSVLELGGCLGIVSCVCNKSLNDRTRHIVVEANPVLIPWIDKNRVLNGAGFSVEHGMLSRTSSGDFYIHKFIVSGSAQLGGGTKIKVPVFSIDALCQKHGLIPTTLIMDIEGGEVDFLEENSEWLIHHNQLKKIIVEVHPFIVGDDKLRRFRTHLGLLGFTIKDSQGTVEAWIRP